MSECGREGGREGGSGYVSCPRSESDYGRGCVEIAQLISRATSELTTVSSGSHLSVFLSHCSSHATFLLRSTRNLRCFNNGALPAGFRLTVTEAGSIITRISLV